MAGKTIDLWRKFTLSLLITPVIVTFSINYLKLKCFCISVVSVILSPNSSSVLNIIYHAQVAILLSVIQTFNLLNQMSIECC